MCSAAPKAPGGAQVSYWSSASKQINAVMNKWVGSPCLLLLQKDPRWDSTHAPTQWHGVYSVKTISFHHTWLPLLRVESGSEWALPKSELLLRGCCGPAAQTRLCHHSSSWSEEDTHFLYKTNRLRCQESTCLLLGYFTVPPSSSRCSLPWSEHRLCRLHAKGAAFQPLTPSVCATFTCIPLKHLQLLIPSPFQSKLSSWWEDRTGRGPANVSSERMRGS